MTISIFAKDEVRFDWMPTQGSTLPTNAMTLLYAEEVHILEGLDDE